MADIWTSSDAYELYMGRWSRSVASTFVSWLGVPAGSSWLDVGCGTGALTQTILSTEPSRVVGVEPSEAFVDQARRAVTDPRVSFVRGQVADVEERDFDAVVSGLVLNFLPDVEQAFREMAQRVSPGGVVAAYVWDYAAGMQLMRHFWDAAREVDAEALQQDEGRRFSICSPSALRALFTAELAGVEVTEVTVATPFASFEDYWRPFLGGVGSAPAYVMSLRDDRREDLRERLRAQLPTAPDGSIALTARAWAVKGIR